MVFFRDTANGFFAWAVAAVIRAAVLASAASSLLSSGTRRSLASGAAEERKPGAVQANPSAYYVDSLFRSDHPNANATDRMSGRDPRILATGMAATFQLATRPILLSSWRRHRSF
jgi:hypothetical protein